MMELRKLIGGLSIQHTKVLSQSASRKEEGSSSKLAPELRSPRDMVTRLDFPWCNVEHFDRWITKVEYYFNMDGTANGDKIKIVTLHLKDKVMRWHQGFMKTHANEMVT